MVFGMGTRLGFGTPLGANVTAAPNVQEVRAETLRALICTRPQRLLAPCTSGWLPAGGRHMSVRCAGSAVCWSGAQVVPLWRFWREHALADAEMVGWWADPADLLVTTSDADVKATVFALRHEGKLVVSLGNFANVSKSVTLEFSAGLAVTGSMEAPAIEAFQNASSFATAEPVPCPSKRGWLLVVGAEFGSS